MNTLVPSLARGQALRLARGQAFRSEAHEVILSGFAGGETLPLLPQVAPGQQCSPWKTKGSMYDQNVVETVSIRIK
jgi:hypothetical protein